MSAGCIHGQYLGFIMKPTNGTGGCFRPRPLQAPTGETCRGLVAGSHIGGDGLIGSFRCMLKRTAIGGTKLDAATLAIWGFKRGRRGAAPKR